MSKVLILGVEQALAINFAQRLQRLGHDVLLFIEQSTLVEPLQKLGLSCYIGDPLHPLSLLPVLSQCQLLYVFPSSVRFNLFQSACIQHSSHAQKEYQQQISALGQDEIHSFFQFKGVQEWVTNTLFRSHKNKQSSRSPVILPQEEKRVLDRDKRYYDEIESSSNTIEINKTWAHSIVDCIRNYQLDCPRIFWVIPAEILLFPDHIKDQQQVHYYQQERDTYAYIQSHLPVHTIAHAQLYGLTYLPSHWPIWTQRLLSHDLSIHSYDQHFTSSFLYIEDAVSALLLLVHKITDEPLIYLGGDHVKHSIFIDTLLSWKEDIKTHSHVFDAVSKLISNHRTHKPKKEQILFYENVPTDMLIEQKVLTQFGYTWLNYAQGLQKMLQAYLNQYQQ